MVLARLTGSDNRTMLITQFQNLRDIINPALTKAARMYQVGQHLQPVVREPEMSRRVPPCLLDACTRLLRQDTPHCLPQQMLSDAVSDLHMSGHPKHELEQPVIEEWIDVHQSKCEAITVLCAQATGSGFAKDILVGSILQA